jgi:UDP-N-acetylglucosamine 1-carboxyvinyltransferase
MTITNIIPQHLDAILSKLQEIGISMEIFSDEVRVFGNDPDKPLKPTTIRTKPYPGFATDVQQPFTPLLTRVQGESSISEEIYPERFKHCFELNKMGADITVDIPSCTIHGPTPLHGADVTATDLRCGAGLVIAALMAQGETVIRSIGHIDRGYDNLDAKLSALGADIRREVIED